MQHVENELLTPVQAAEALGVSRTTITRIVQAGRLPQIEISARVRRFRREDVESLLRPITR